MTNNSNGDNASATTAKATTHGVHLRESLRLQHVNQGAHWRRPGQRRTRGSLLERQHWLQLGDLASRSRVMRKHGCCNNNATTTTPNSEHHQQTHIQHGIALRAPSVTITTAIHPGYSSTKKGGQKWGANAIAPVPSLERFPGRTHSRRMPSRAAAAEDWRQYRAG
jgi:hypothetical protein